MIALDTNILVAFHRQEYPTHEKARKELKALAEGTAPWAIPWPCIHEFAAVATNVRIFKEPSTPKEIIAVVDAWMKSPVLRLLGEGIGYWEQFQKILLQSNVSGARVHDARIVSICLDHGVECLWTADRDFSRFPSLKCFNPMIEV